MSFDLFLQCFKAGEPAEADKQAVRAVLRRHCEEIADKFGFYRVLFADGSSVEFSAKGLESDTAFTGCAFHLRGFSPAVISFVLDVANAGDMAIFNAQGNNSAESPTFIIIRPVQAAEAPKDMDLHPVLCSSAEQLGELLGFSAKNWSDFRDHVLSRTTP